MRKGIPLELTLAARKAIRLAVLDFIRTNRHRDYKFSDIAAVTGYPTTSIAVYVRKYLGASHQPKSRRQYRKSEFVDKPEYVLDVEKSTGLKAFPYNHKGTGTPEWRLMSPTGVLLMILIGDEDLLHAVRATQSLSALQGISRIEREIRTSKRRRRSRDKDEMDITELADKLWENEENE